MTPCVTKSEKHEEQEPMFMRKVLEERKADIYSLTKHSMNFPVQAILFLEIIRNK
jgi:hypothetical protein